MARMLVGRCLGDAEEKRNRGPSLADEEKFLIRPIEAIPSVNLPPSEISFLLKPEQPLPAIT